MQTVIENMQISINFSPSLLSYYSSYHLPRLKYDSSSSNLNKEILGHHKPPNLLSSEIVPKNLGTYETYSSSYLVKSTCSKSKVIAV